MVHEQSGIKKKKGQDKIGISENMKIHKNRYRHRNYRHKKLKRSKSVDDIKSIIKNEEKKEKEEEPILNEKSFFVKLKELFSSVELSKYNLFTGIEWDEN